MSRRPPNPAAERAAQNQQTIKSLLKLEPNKICADCKRNKHPRWASWNLGVFICIRCSGIHRGMGTHISRVKSVDLDSWTDEQLQSILSWGNARANKYWESKLATGHVPSEAKIENFIRTKYELKRWVMDGPKPDPATLDVDGDDDIPLSIVKEKQNIDRKESIRKSPTQATGGAAAAASLPKPAAAQSIDLIGGTTSPVAPPPRASTAGPAAAQVPPKGVPAPPKATSHTAKDSLLGLDFLGSQPAASARPSSTTGALSSGGTSRPDLKQSILSLYATAPRTTSPTVSTAQQPARPAVANDPFANLGSPTMSSRNSVASASGGGGLVDAFSSLNFSAAPAPTTSPKPVDAFAGLSHSRPGSTVSHTAHKSNSSAFGSLGGGSFFNAKPAPAPAPTTTSPKPAPASSPFGGLGGFGAFSSTPSPPAPQAPAASNAFGDLFDFTAPAATTTTSAPAPAPAPVSSVFNLSLAQPARAAATSAATPTSPLAAVSANWSNADVWGNDGWSTADAGGGAAASATATITSPTLTRTNDFGWGSAAPATTSTSGGSFASQSIVPGTGGGFATTPKVAADEEFGGWTSGTTTTTTASGSGNGNAKATGGFGGNEDLFSNVWG